jgi:hypothetical protein
MIQDLRTAVFLALVVACVAAAGCTGNEGNGAMTPVPPAGTVNTIPGARTDLTNQYSPQAATFSDGASCTPLD